MIYKDVDLYTANICWKGEEDELARTVQVDTSLLLASRHLWDRDPTPMESVTPTQRLQVCPPRWLTAQMLITGCKQCPRLTHNLTSDIHSSARALGNQAARHGCTHATSCQATAAPSHHPPSLGQQITSSMTPPLLCTRYFETLKRFQNFLCHKDTTAVTAVFSKKGLPSRQPTRTAAPRPRRTTLAS